jgi:tRNA (guanosine-2'-O-)-methyltransferase
MTPERSARLHQVLAMRQPDLTLVTDFVHKQRNLSALVRNADAAGIMRVHAVLGDEDYQAYRGTAMGAHHWVEVCCHATVAQALQPLQDAGYQLVAAHPVDAAVDFRAVDYTVPTALVLGAERQGLSDAALAAVTHFVRVPMMGMVGSLNVSVAAGIVLSEVQHQRQRAGLYDRCRIDSVTYHRLYFEWAHPVVARYCQAHGLRYPPLDKSGEIDQPARWYASVRAGAAPLWRGTPAGAERDDHAARRDVETAREGQP